MKSPTGTLITQNLELGGNLWLMATGTGIFYEFVKRSQTHTKTLIRSMLLGQLELEQNKMLTE